MHPDYELLGEIGQNAYGTVYRGFRFSLKRNVAIFEVRQEFRNDPKRMEVFWDQILQLANMTHDHIVPVIGVEKDCGWIVMDLMQSNLAEEVAKGPVPADRVRTMLRDALDAVQFLHSQGALHGDIRPATLLVSNLGRTKLSFSIGMALCGEIPWQRRSKKYLVPELLNREFGEPGPGIDIYSLGFAALELLIGPQFNEHFCRGGQDPEMFWAHLHASTSEKIPPVKELVPDVPDDLARVIDRMLIKNVGERPQSAEAIRAELVDRPPSVFLVASEPSPTPPDPTPVPEPIAVPKPSLPAPSAEPAPPGALLSSLRSNTKPIPVWRRLKEKGTILTKWYILYPGATVLFFAIGLTCLVVTDCRKTPAAATLQLSSDPPGATIWVDGKKAPGKDEKPRTTPDKLPLRPGEYLVKLTKEGYPPSEEYQVKVVEGKNDVDPFHHKFQPPRPAESPPKPSSAVPSTLIAKPGTAVDPDLKLPQRVLVKALADSVPMELVLMKPGTFDFGASARGIFPGELPSQNRTIRHPYYIATTEVSNRQYSVFLKAAGGETSEAERIGDSDPQTADLPVVGISLEEARRFCGWIGGRLPTEEEWERAARGSAGKGFPYPWGAANLNEYHCNLFFGSKPKLLPVDELPNGATASGLLNMLGNAAEWCRDSYQPGHGETKGDPDLEGAYTVRGCSFVKPPGREVRVTWRAPEKPAGAKDVGFRAVVPFPAPPP